MKPKPLRIDEAIIANGHVEQFNARFFARNSVRFAHYELATVLALIIHIGEKSKDRATKISVSCALEIIIIAILFRADRLNRQFSESSDWFFLTLRRRNVTKLRTNLSQHRFTKHSR
jgi:hypothetical protein